MVIDPVLPKTLDGLEFQFNYAGMAVTFIYHVDRSEGTRITINGQDVAADAIRNRYRTGGVRIAGADFKRLAGEGGTDCVVDIYASIHEQ